MPRLLKEVCDKNMVIIKQQIEGVLLVVKKQNQLNQTTIAHALPTLVSGRIKVEQCTKKCENNL